MPLSAACQAASLPANPAPTTMTRASVPVSEKTAPSTMRLPSRQSETRPYLLRKAAPRCYDFFPVVFFAGFFFPFVVIAFFDTAFSVSTAFAAALFLAGFFAAVLAVVLFAAV